MIQIQLVCDGNLASADVQPRSAFHAVHDVVKKAFQYVRRSRADYAYIKATGRVNKFETFHLTHLDEGKIIFPVNLQHEFHQLAKDNGWTVVMRDLRPPIPEPCYDDLSYDKIKDRDDQMEAIAAVFSNPCGVISGPTGQGKTFMIGQICRAYPKLRIVIVSYRREVVRSIYERLRRNGDVPADELGIVGGGAKQIARVTVSTIGSLEYARADEADLLLYDEVHEAAAEDRATKLGALRKPRMFGFSASALKRSDGTNKLVTAIFGPVIYLRKYQESQQEGHIAKITVQMHSSKNVVAIHGMSDTNRERWGLWRNANRNFDIAKWARAELAAGKQVMVACETVEHILFLRHNFLSDWTIVHGECDTESIDTFRRLGVLPDGPKSLCNDKLRDLYRRQFETGVLRNVIASDVWLQGVDFPYLDALIRCDARTSSIINDQLGGRLSRGRAGTLHDFLDEFDANFKRRAQTRMRDYAKNGWSIIRC